MLKVLVTGANGQVGSELASLSKLYPQYAMTFIDRSILDMSDSEAVELYLSKNSFDAIINCAAYTAVDKAESENSLADAINHHAVRALATAAKKNGIILIHISTDYVFDGCNHRPYIETDPTDPHGVYGRTKRDGENAIIKIAPSKALIIRTSWVYSSYGNNFVKTMLRLGKERENLGVIFDQVGTPTYAHDLAAIILDILPRINNNVPEFYHFSNEGCASWYDFAKAIFELSGVACMVNPITTAQYPTPAKRPHYSLLNKAKIKNDFGISIPYWRDSLKQCLKALGEIS